VFAVNSILVCYATRYGSTTDIARLIGEELQRAGYAVTVLPIAEVGNPGEYDAVVIGSPLYMGKWLAEARDFVSRFRYPLQERPVAVFSVGYSLRDQNVAHLKSGDDALGAIRLFVSPVSTGFFPGKTDPDRMSAADRAIVTLGGAMPGDFRDPDLVRNWARELAGLLAA